MTKITHPELDAQDRPTAPEPDAGFDPYWAGETRRIALQAAIDTTNDQWSTEDLIDRAQKFAQFLETGEAPPTITVRAAPGGSHAYILGEAGAPDRIL